MIERCSNYCWPASPSGPYDSYHRLYADDPSISYIHLQHVPPPGNAGNYIDYICNRERILPAEASGYYHEYTVPTPGSSDRGARRIVTGSQGEYYYSGDHYGSFVVVDVSQ